MRKKKVHQTHTFDDALINLTPLIDVVFVILIAFILVAPLLEVDQVELASSSPASEKSLQDKSKISIYVKADNSIWLNGRKVLPHELEKNLKALKGSEKTIKLFHDKKALFGTYQIVKNAVEASGFQQMDVILKPN